MELIKRNIHMDRVKRSTVMQFTMEEDLNLPEDKPDISTLNLEKGEIVIEEIRPGMDEVTVRGKLGYAILYHTQEAGSSLILLSGALPFEEKIHMEGTLPSDTVAVDGTVEDFTVNMINSRKLNLQTLLCLTARIEEIYDEELPVGIQGDSGRRRGISDISHGSDTACHLQKRYFPEKGGDSSAIQLSECVSDPVEQYIPSGCGDEASGREYFHPGRYPDLRPL